MNYKEIQQELLNFKNPNKVLSQSKNNTNKYYQLYCEIIDNTDFLSDNSNINERIYYIQSFRQNCTTEEPQS